MLLIINRILVILAYCLIIGFLVGNYQNLKKQNKQLTGLSF